MYKMSISQTITIEGVKRFINTSFKTRLRLKKEVLMGTAITQDLKKIVIISQKSL